MGKHTSTPTNTTTEQGPFAVSPETQAAFNGLFYRHEEGVARPNSSNFMDTFNRAVEVVGALAVKYPEAELKNAANFVCNATLEAQHAESLSTGQTSAMPQATEADTFLETTAVSELERAA